MLNKRLAVPFNPWIVVVLRKYPSKVSIDYLTKSSEFPQCAYKASSVGRRTAHCSQLMSDLLQ
jgi:hypothetical protein